MAWDHLSITKPHLVYIILGGFTSLFMLCSSVIKERAYIGEATVATICGLIFGPHAANLINPQSWGNVDEVTLEFSRIVLVVQCFAVGVELPKFYMEKHWKSVTLLLIPVMTFGWLITSLFVWWMIPPLDWLASLTVAACVTATDPVLASSVVGKGKFAKRVPKHLRDLLSAESGCNDGMAFPFIYLALYLIQDDLEASKVTFHWIVYTILYECVFGAVYGFLIGYFARHGIKYAERHELIDRESFLVFYFTLALFCAGSGSILGVDDLLVGFSCGVGFSNDGWFSSKTEESHVSNVIDLLLNLAYFVFLGTIIPWEQYNNVDMGLSVWKLCIIAIFVILFRRIPIMMALKPLIPDIKTWREALFAGHFGPIGVGAIFVAIMARAELETEKTIPLAELPPEGTPHYTLIALVWPIVTFLVISSIIVHGSSIAVFTLGKHINTLTLTMSYTAAPDDGPGWMNRLPRISSISRSQARTMSDTDGDDLKSPDFPPGTLPPTGLPGQFLRRQRDEENPARSHSRSSSHGGRRRRAGWEGGIGPGGPVSESAIFPQRRSSGGLLEISSPETRERSPSEKQGYPDETVDDESPNRQRERDAEKDAEKAGALSPRDTRNSQGSPDIEIYDEGDHIVIEDGQGEVLAVDETEHHHPHAPDLGELKEKAKSETQKPGWTLESLKKSLGKWRAEEAHKRHGEKASDRKHAPARAYQFGNTIIVEDEDGEVVKKYDLPPNEAEASTAPDRVNAGLKYLGMSNLVKPKAGEEASVPGPSGAAGPSRPEPKPGIVNRPSFANWRGFSKTAVGDRKKDGAVKEEDEKDDRQVRFTLAGEGRRMTKDDFLKAVQNMDARTRREVLEHSDAPQTVKTTAREQAQMGSSAPANIPRPGPAKTATWTRSSTASDIAAAAKPAKAPMARGRSEVKAGGDLETMPESPGSPGAHNSTKTPETAVEKRRRLAALSGVKEEGAAEETETPAERRRRQAALGVGGEEIEEESDSEDDDTPRVPPARRGIRFAEPTPPRAR